MLKLLSSTSGVSDGWQFSWREKGVAVDKFGDDPLLEQILERCSQFHIWLRRFIGDVAPDRFVVGLVAGWRSETQRVE